MLKEAIIFTIGCSILVTNAVLSFLPYVGLRFKLPDGVIYVECVLSVASCTLFLIGSIFSFLEAIRWTRGKWSGWQLDLASDSDLSYGKTGSGNDPEKGSQSTGGLPSARATAFWAFLPTAHELCHLGIIACSIFLCSSIVYCSTSIIALITVLKDGQIVRWIRYPQLVAAIGFAMASMLLMLKAQRNWWRPAVERLSWHVNLWNLIGSAGFIFCSGFGLMENVYWAQYQFGCSYLWGK